MGRSRVVWLAAVVVAVLAAGCSGDDDGGGGEAGRTEDGSTATTEGPAPLDVLVTNDDGFEAEGIDTLIEALRGQEAIEVTVVAPATQQSGTGGRETDGEVATRQGATRSGYVATVVGGYPSDAVRVALEDLGLHPDLVISGINEGQNLGPLVDISGTVGAARAAARSGIPALAVSQGLGSPLDYPAAAELVIDWLADNRAALASGDLPADHVVNLNVPTCPQGEVRGAVEVTSATGGDALAAPGCTSTDQGQTDDVSAFVDGYATFADVPVEPAAA